MPIRLHGLAIPYDQAPGEALPRLLAEKLGGRSERIAGFRIARRSIDARSRPVKLVYTVDIDLTDGADSALPGATETPLPVPLRVTPGQAPLQDRPLVVGGGPAGLFAALLLAEHGYAPLLVDRGGDVENRVEALRAFLQTREPDPECNLLFGLGGAGAFSDGKLNTGVSHPWLPAVLGTLVECGAPQKILTDARPHVGTDVLRQVIGNLVRRIEASGGNVWTGCRIDGLRVEHGRIAGAESSGGAIPAEALVLAIGHSARDTWAMLAHAGILLEPKPFQIGIRVEHPQGWLDRARYGDAAGHPALGAAEYRLATRVRGTPVFSFCMCPGGETVATVNEAGHLALNGMSYAARSSATASSGIVVTLTPEHYGGRDLASCLAFQRGVERACFEAGGSSYRAPAERLVDFVQTPKVPQLLPESSYRLGLEPARLEQILPGLIADPLRAAFSDFEKRLPGYLHPEAVALAPESRASSPIRIARNPDSLESPSASGLYPVGEGAGYAGGIMSSALDGLNAARKIIERHAPPENPT